MAERGSMMLLHSLLISLVSFLIMVYVAGMPMRVSENRSMLVLGGSLIYMVLFGHKLPSF